jgi:hypothetical protein
MPGCPNYVPSNSCQDEGLVCGYGICCPITATCENGMWNVSNCAAPMCPSDPPKNLTTCYDCNSLPSCSYDRCAIDGNTYEALCELEGENGLLWIVSKVPCPMP